MAPPRRGSRFIQQGQSGGGVYEGIEQPDTIMRGLRAAGNPITAGQPVDKILLMQQAEASRKAYEQRSEAAAKASDESRDMMSPGWRPGSEEERVRSQNAMSRARSAGGDWDLWFQALQNQGVDKLQGGPSPMGSNQLRGFGQTQVVNRGGFSQYPTASWAPAPGESLPPGYTKERFEAEADEYRRTGKQPSFLTTPGGAPQNLLPGVGEHWKQSTSQRAVGGLKRARR